MKTESGKLVVAGEKWNFPTEKFNLKSLGMDCCKLRSRGRATEGDTVVDVIRIKTQYVPTLQIRPTGWLWTLCQCFFKSRLTRNFSSHSLQGAQDRTDHRNDDAVRASLCLNLSQKLKIELQHEITTEIPLPINGFHHSIIIR